MSSNRANNIQHPLRRLHRFHKCRHYQEFSSRTEYGNKEPTKCCYEKGIAKRAKSKNRMQIIESDNINVFWENLDENERQILV